MELTAYARDNFVAPEMSQFTSASIEDMTGTSEAQGHWLYNFMLNSLLRSSTDELTRQTFFNFLRRTQFAFREYDLARKTTAAFLEDGRSVPTYFIAVGHWEAFLSYTYQAFELLAGREKRALFEPNDGSVLQRLCLLNNRAKHVNKAINAGQVAAGSTLAAWPTNDGLQAVDSSLTFDEMAGMLRQLALWSDAIQDPKTMRKKLAAHITPARAAQDSTDSD